MTDADANWAEYIKAGSEAFVLLKTLYPLLPTQNRDEIEAKIEAAQDALQKANVSLAQGWGFKIHDCTFPPQIMLYDNNLRERVCRGCGFRTNFSRKLSSPDEEDEYLSVRR
jgi:hypothetical protein